MQAELLEFMREFVYPAEPRFEREGLGGAEHWERPPVMAELKKEARSRGLWNLFLPDSPYGPGLTNLQYAPLAEISGRSPYVAPEALNCNPPDSGNMELLSMFASEAQKQRWLVPLLEGEIRSAYCMTEPGVASSDASNIATTIRRDGDSYVVNGRKWWSTGALSRDCKVLVVLGISDSEAPRRDRQSVILIPTDTPGVRIVRGLRLVGYEEGVLGGHAEIDFDQVQVPVGNLLGEEGSGARMAQARLGPGRIHHAMRLIGMAERAFELLCARAGSRQAFGGRVADKGVVHGWIAHARVRIESVRLLVLRTAWLIDTVGPRGARAEISAIKIAAPAMAEWVIDKAIQVHGGAGLSQDTPLAMLWAQTRGLRIGDGPDEVHEMVLARHELRRVEAEDRT